MPALYFFGGSIDALKLSFPDLLPISTESLGKNERQMKLLSYRMNVFL
jgi:hypothetical protein